MGSKQALPPFDVFSYGVSAYEVLGQPLRAGGDGQADRPTDRETVDRDAGQPRSLSSSGRCLAIEPGQRQTAEELSAAFAANQGI